MTKVQLYVMLVLSNVKMDQMWEKKGGGGPSNMIKIVSHLAGIKRLWYEDDCIYLKVYMVYVYIVLLLFKIIIIYP